NIFADAKTKWAEVSWDEVAARNPDVIILADLTRGEPNDTAKEKIALLKKDPLTSKLAAVKGDKFITIPGSHMDPSYGSASTVPIVTASLFGSANIRPLDVVSTILRHIGLGGIAPTPPLPGLLDALIWESRFPRVLLAVAIGMALAVSGAVLQAVTRNPLADPYLLGVSSGASTGAVAVLLLGIGGSVSLSTGAFAGGLVSFGLLLLLLGGGRVASPSRVVLTGVLVSQFFAGVTSVILMVNGDANSTRGFTYWLLGTLGGARWEGVTVTVLIILAGVVA
ncbi:iron chelate uptake ABC transporter family permease subunit, partial [Streptomyces bikiniensis]|uniref:iron chelate uptake ABC transporter family permease subunit n=1 Tax=Streptomyces bikiniensis TaxID=1896 RepID=UPI00131C4AB3